MKNLDGRVVIVTGGSGGIGIVASELMANLALWHLVEPEKGPMLKSNASLIRD